MSAATVAIAATAIGVAGAAGSAVAKKNAQNRAANAREDALNQLKLLDIPELNRISEQYDESSYKGRLDLQKRVDPASAEARTAGLDALVTNIDGNDAKAGAFIDKIAEDQADPALDALRTKLLATAQESLDAGATLSPEFQAELVRTGLEASGRAGFALDKKGAAGQTLRKLTGAAGEALQTARVDRAGRAIDSAQSITSTRANILNGLVSQLQSMSQGKTARAATAFQAGASQTPDRFGLTGEDAARLSVANTELENERILGKGEIKAGRAIAKGEYISSLIGAGTSGAQGIMGSFTKLG